jgi:peptidyl-prolyl cis-trans isomerase D
MLDLIRKKKESFIIKVVFAVIVLSFIGTIFLVWGKGEDGFGSSGAGYAAKVGRTTISLEQYQNSYQRLREIYLQLFGQAAGGLTPELEKQLNIRQAALDRLIDSVLLTKGAKELGVKVGKDEVAASIATMPAFQRNGTFDLALYQQTLKMSRITPNDFEDSQKADLLIAKTRKAIMDKVQVSDDDAKAQYHKERDRVELSYASFSAAELAATAKPSEAELDDYLKNNAERFKSPEKVAISYLVLDPSSQVASQQVTAEEQESFYRKNLDRYLGSDNSPIPFEKVKDRVLADAKRSKAAKAVFEKAADTLYQNIKSADLQLVAGKMGAKISDTGLFTAAAPPQPLAGEQALLQKAFELKAGELGGPLETAKGIYIFKVKEKKPAELLPLAQVRATVEQQVRAAKAAELAKQKAVEAQKQLATSNLSGLKLQTTPAFGYNAKGDLPGIGSSQPLMEAVFKLTSATPALSEPMLVGNRWYAVRIKQRIAAAETDFTGQKEALKQRMLPQRQEEALKTWLKERRDKAKIVINQALLEQ